MPADLLDDRNVLERARQLVPQARPPIAHPLDQTLGSKHVDHGQADGAGEWRAIPGMSGREALRAVRDRVVDGLAAEHGADRSIAGTETLGSSDDVGNDRHALSGEPRSCSPDAGD